MKITALFIVRVTGEMSRNLFITRVTLNRRRQSRFSTKQLLPTDLESLNTQTYTYIHYVWTTKKLL